jgi:predicted nucleic acid-binding protein
MRDILFDTSVYISALLKGDPSVFVIRRIILSRDNRSRPLWLSAVVSGELYAGAADTKARKFFLRMEREFEKLNRLLVPNQADWSLSGRVLAKIGAKYGFEEIGRSRLTNDALIAISAARKGFTVLSKNAADFARIDEFRPFDWEEI